MERDVLRELEELLNDSEEYDPTAPEIDERWARLRGELEPPAPVTAADTNRADNP